MIEQILQLIHDNSNFVLCGHTSPDGDSIGSCFGLAFALEKLGKHATVVLESFSEKYEVLPGSKFLYTGTLDDLKFDVLIALDCADTERLGLGLSLYNRANKTICIDHHETNDGFAIVNLVEPQASSTCEIVYRIVERITQITEDIATVLYAGIVCDTGGFKYSSTARSTMEIAAHLMEIIPFTKIYNEVLHEHSFASGKAKGLALQHANLSDCGRIAYSYITHDEMTRIGVSSADLDGIVEYLLNTAGALMSVFVYGKSETEQKISFRSTGPNVGRIAAAMGGGGHGLAAGCTVRDRMDKVLVLALAKMNDELSTGYIHDNEGDLYDRRN